MGKTTDRSNMRFDMKHAHDAMLESRRFLISFFLMQEWHRRRQKRLKEGWTKGRK
jgi:hypothetical protein